MVDHIVHIASSGHKALTFLMQLCLARLLIQHFRPTTTALGFTMIHAKTGPHAPVPC